MVWLTTVTRAGSPLPNPVWFHWDGAESIVMFSLPGARVRNVEANPRVTLNFAGDGRGGDIVVLSGRATVDRDAPSAARVEPYVEKYAQNMARIGLSPEEFAERYSVPIHVRIVGARGH